MDFKNQSHENDFSFGAEKHFFLLMFGQESPFSGGKADWKGDEKRRLWPFFSLNGRRLLSKSGWHDNRQMPTLAFPCLFGLRTACLSGVRKVSGRRGMIDRRTFVRCARIVSFHRSLLPVRNKAFSWGWNCRFDSLSECHLKRWERPEKQNPLFCWRVRGKHISLPLWKWRNWVRKRKVCCVRSSGITVWTCPNWYSVVSYWQPLCN